MAEEAGQFCIEVFFFRTYQNWGNRAYFPRADRSLGPAEVLDAFLAQFYLERPAPRLVLLSHNIESHDALCEALSVRAGHRIAIGAPQRGEKRELVENATRNAREALSRKLADTATQEKLLARSPPPSASIIRSAASKSTTIPTSWGPMRSAR